MKLVSLQLIQGDCSNQVATVLGNNEYYCNCQCLFDSVG